MTFHAIGHPRHPIINSEGLHSMKNANSGYIFPVESAVFTLLYTNKYGTKVSIVFIV